MPPVSNYGRKESQVAGEGTVMWTQDLLCNVEGDAYWRYAGARMFPAEDTGSRHLIRLDAHCMGHVGLLVSESQDALSAVSVPLDTLSAAFGNCIHTCLLQQLSTAATLDYQQTNVASSRQSMSDNAD